MNWRNLYYGYVSAQEVQKAVNDPAWQALRRSIKGRSLQDKYDELIHYKWKMRSICGGDARAWRRIEVQLTNYVTALSRGGLIKPEDYR